MKKTFNPLALIGFLGLFGILGPLTGNASWYWWFAWFSWFTNYKKPVDERFFSNITKTGLACFAVAMLGLMVLLFMKDLNMSKDLILTGLELLFTVCLLSFVFLLRYFEDHGE